MSIKDLIDQAYNKDAGAFEQTFDAIMSEKMSNAIGAKYDEMFGAQEEVEEEVVTEDEEILDESKDEEEDEDEDEDESEEEDEDEDED
jgi:hypothetical protein